MLTDKQMKEIKELQTECEQDGGFDLKLNWDMLAARKDGKKDDFFHYENDKLVGFLGLYGFGNKVELCGMVHPDWRRRGIFNRLLEEAIEEAKNRGTRQILLNAPAGSNSAKGFLETVPNRYFVTESRVLIIQN